MLMMFILLDITVGGEMRNDGDWDCHLRNVRNDDGEIGK